MKEIKINVPKGYEIDEKNSTFECIKFKPVGKQIWRNTEAVIDGYYISNSSIIIGVNELSGPIFNEPSNYNVFAAEKQAKSALAMARISQIMANDERFGGVVTDEEWDDTGIIKYVLYRYVNRVVKSYVSGVYHYLAFHTEEQRDLFLKENKDLIKDYLML